MGIKRISDDGVFVALSPENHKRHDYGERHTSSSVEASLHVTELILTSPGQVESKSNEVHYKYDQRDGTFMANKELESSLPISAVTSTSSEEDAGNGDSSYIDLSTLNRRVECSKDTYRSLLEQSPIKEIPLGLEYQAQIPPFDPNSRAKRFSASNYFLGGNKDHKLMGTCIMEQSYSDDFIIYEHRVGHVRTDCACFDVGSMRCVQQHIAEAREKLRENIGEKAYAELGFHDMGEIVACKWTTDEEQLFHEIVFSNPPSLGRNFWSHLSLAFPKRSMMELVGYYFNVFMLRRRAIQNRSHLLEIDSDDDEEHKGDDGDVYENDIEDDCLYFIAKGDEEDSTIDSLDDRGLDSIWVNGFWPEPDRVDPASNNGKFPSPSSDVVKKAT